MRTFANILFHVLRLQRQERGPGFDTISKQQDQLCNLLAIAITLCPQVCCRCRIPWMLDFCRQTVSVPSSLCDGRSALTTACWRC